MIKIKNPDLKEKINFSKILNFFFVIIKMSDNSTNDEITKSL